MIDFGLMGGMYAVLHAVHGAADYWQSKTQSNGWRNIASQILWYGFSFGLVGVALYWIKPDLIETWKLFCLPVVIGAPHAWMVRQNAKRMLQANQGMVFMRVNMDKQFHWCLMLAAAWLAYK